MKQKVEAKKKLQKAQVTSIKNGERPQRRRKKKPGAGRVSE